MAADVPRTDPPKPPAAFTVVVSRRIKAGREADYVKIMRDFIAFALSCPGYQAISVLRPATPGSDHTVVGKFTSESARRAFTSTPEYAAWMARLAELTEGNAVFLEHSVLDEWLRSPSIVPTVTPPKWKTACATFVGVFPVVTILGFTLAPATKSWPLVASSAMSAACVVALLNWVVMPVVSQLLRPWLYPAAPITTATTTTATSST